MDLKQKRHFWCLFCLNSNELNFFAVQNRCFKYRYIEIYLYGGEFVELTDAAKEMILPILEQNPGKTLRVVFEGFG